MNENQFSAFAREAFPSVPKGIVRSGRAGSGENAFPSRELQEFILHQINSIEQLEILLHLFRHREKWWNAAEVYEVVKSSTRSVQDRLTHFCNHSILEKNGCEPACYRYVGGNAERERLISELDHQYRERRVRVIEFIYSQPANGMTEFARAFQIRRED